MFLALFWAHVGQPDGHLGWTTLMPLASIYPTNPRTNPWNFVANRVWPNQVKSWKWVIFVNQHDFKWMYDISYESTHSQLYCEPKKLSNSKIHILTISGQMSIKPPIVINCATYLESISPFPTYQCDLWRTFSDSDIHYYLPIYFYS